MNDIDFDYIGKLIKQARRDGYYAADIEIDVIAQYLKSIHYDGSYSKIIAIANKLDLTSVTWLSAMFVFGVDF